MQYSRVVTCIVLIFLCITLIYAYMDAPTQNPKLHEQLEKLQEKYEAMGQDMSSYLDGLLYANYLTYWDYIHLDTLLSLQNPKTDFPDESIFIMYHQITELYFKMVLNELKQLTQKAPTPDFFIQRLTRCNKYFAHLVSSFEIMVEGMEKEQFLKFRMSLLPSSGFQSVQYRMIEFHAAPIAHLLVAEKRDAPQTTQLPVGELMEHIYWKEGAVELATGNKTLTLRMFEQKYKKKLTRLAEKMHRKNLWRTYLRHIADTPEASRVAEVMRTFDQLVNVQWPLAHFKSAVRYLQRDPEAISATGGTNWQKYLPPRFQKRIFFPDLWSEQEKQEWGKRFILDALAQADGQGAQSK